MHACAHIKHHDNHMLFEFVTIHSWILVLSAMVVTQLVWTLLALWMFKNKSRRYCGLKAFSGHPITRIFWNHCFVWSTFKDDGILTHSLEVPQCIAQWIYYSKACHNNDYCIREISENNLNRKTVNIVKTSIRFDSFRFYLFGCLFSFSICFRVFHWLSMGICFFCDSVP